MKLSKLIPTVASLGVTITAAPIVFSSCSCSKNLRDINIKNGYNPGTKQSHKEFETFSDMNKEYLKLSATNRAKDYVWDVSQNLLAAQETGTSLLPFSIKTLTSANMTVESWFTKPLEFKSPTTQQVKTYIETNYQYIINISGISGRSATQYIPEDSDINYQINFEVNSLPYSFTYGDYKWDGKKVYLLAPMNVNDLKTIDSWHASGQVIASYKKKYSDTETVLKVDTISVYWNYESFYDMTKEEEYAKKSYIYPILFRHLFYKSFFFANHTCKEVKE